MIHMIGNAHIDPVWLWDWREGYQEVKATFRSALDRLSENDQFVFTCACADYYRWIEENAPDMFDEIRRRVAEGRWRIVGGMWIQPDCNMPSGEAVSRQLLYSQRYFMEKFGRTAVTGYNVDSFGHGATLPQLLRAAGIENYVFMRPGEHENADIPAPLFTWVSPDGSGVTAFRIPDAYCSKFGECDKKIELALDMERAAGMSMMCFYGVGNHGGGPTIANLKAIEAYRQRTGAELQYSHPDAYFDEIRASNAQLPVWRREMQHHASGCYSAFSKIKRLNRRTESALFQAERFGVLAARVAGHPIDPMTQGFRNMMFNQFHDVMCGCCIPEAYEDATVQLGEAISIAERAQHAALSRISWRVDTMQGLNRLRSKESHFMLWENGGMGTPVVVFNAHEFAATGPVHVLGRIARATDEAGEPAPVQTVRASRTNGADKWDSIFQAQVPPMGWRLYWIYLEGEAEPAPESEISVDEHSMDNGRIKACFDPQTGALVSLVNKRTGFEAISGQACARLIDVEHVDTWAHGVFAFDKEAGGFGGAKFEILERGPVRGKLRVTTRHGESTLVQEYMLYADGDQLEIEARLDLREKFRMVKLCFPTGRHDAISRAEVAYGIARRAANGLEEICHRFVQMGGESGGLAILNDGKYSYSASQGEIRLTVANSSIFADHYGQNDRDDSCRHMDLGEQSFRYALIPHGCDWRALELTRRAALFQQPLARIVETYHAGDLPARYGGMAVNARNLRVGAVKRAEDGDGYVIRLTETEGRPCEDELDMPVLGRKVRVSLTPWQIKTIFLPDDPQQMAQERLITEYAPN